MLKDFSEVVADRIQREPEFARALLGEAIAVFLNGETRCVPVVAAGFGKWDDRF
jgi:hypothetical protein